MSGILKDIIKIKWTGSSVSGLVVIAGIISIVLGVASRSPFLSIVGVFFVIGGGILALLISGIINNGRRSRW